MSPNNASNDSIAKLTKKDLSETNQLSIDRFIDELWLQDGLSDNTLQSYRIDLSQFARWLETEFAKNNILTISKTNILHYLAYRVDKKYKARSTSRLLSTLKRFYIYAVNAKLIAQNPTADIAMPKVARTLPKTLSEQDIEKLLEAPDVSTAYGLRDKCMLETIYATGLRVTELVTITLSQINLASGWLRVTGKGNKERIVPLGELAVDWLDKYLKEGRVELIKSQHDGVFISSRGSCITRQAFWQMIKKYALIANIDANFSPHTLRHAFATHLLNHGADLRTVQMLLGHTDLSTTQIYTHIAKDRLQKLHSQHHPRG